MSVPEGKRKPTTLEVFVKAKELATYTINITSNQKNFPPEYDSRITNRIVDTAINIYVKSCDANDIRVNGDHDKWIKRRDLSRESIQSCRDLLKYIDIAKSVLHIRGKRYRNWTGMVCNVQTKLQAWHKSDVDRYGDL